MTPRTRGAVFIALAVAGLAFATVDTPLHPAGLAIAALFFFLATGVFSRAGGLAHSLQPLVRISVRVEIRGLPLEGGAIFEVESIKAVGAGLLIHLRAASGGSRRLLKIAQPRSPRPEQSRFEIGSAAYVSWAGARQPLVAGTKAPAVVLIPVS